MRHPFPRGWRPFINVQWKNRKLATRLWLVASSQIQRMMTFGSVDDHILFPPPFDRSLISPRRGWLSLESFHELLRALFFSLLLHFRTSFVGIFFLAFRLDIFRFVIFPSQFRRFDASSFESSFNIYMLYRGDLLVRLYLSTTWYFFCFFLSERESFEF